MEITLGTVVLALIVMAVVNILNGRHPWDLRSDAAVARDEALRELGNKLAEERGAKWSEKWDVEFWSEVDRHGAETRAELHALKLWRQPSVGEAVVEDDGTISIKVEFPDKTEKHKFPAGTNRYRIGDFVSELKQQYEENPAVTPILVRAPNGEIVVFRAGTDPEWIGDWMQRWRGGFSNYFPEVLESQRERPSCPRLEENARAMEESADRLRRKIAEGTATDDQRRAFAFYEEAAARTRRQIQGVPEPADRS